MTDDIKDETFGETVALEEHDSKLSSEPPAAEPDQATDAVESPAEPDTSPPVSTADAAATSDDAPAAPAGDDPEQSAETVSPAADVADDKTATRKMGKARQARIAGLFRAYRSRRSLEGRVERVIKGGYEIKIGRVRGFCPHSQIDVRRVEDPESLTGKSFLFQITQLRRGGEDVVVSRRAILEEQLKDEAAAVRATLVEGSIRQGHVAGTAPFGAFVDLGAGVMGLVHLSEISHARVATADEAVNVGETVQVKVLKVDDKRGRVSLSIRQAQEDPWTRAAERFVPGGLYPGAVRRLTDYGVFVEMAPGIEALAPVSELPPTRLSWRERLKPGESREWLVLSVTPTMHRISLTPAEDGARLIDPTTLEVGTTMQGKVQRVERFGVFVWLGPGCVGLMPNVWTGVPRGEDVVRRFPVADTVEVEIVEVAPDGKRIRLARKGVDYKATAAPREARPRRPERPAPRQDSPPSSEPAGAFGTILADKLKAALGQSQNGS